MDIEIVLDDADSLICHRCGRAALLVVRVPTVMRMGSGQVSGRRTVELCSHCDRNEVSAQGVLAYFSVYERIDREAVDAAGPVLREWLDYLVANPPRYTDSDMDQEIRDWESGEM
ncbi:DUF6300 family protein [Amycolatopsis sp. NPDC049868]|uniref:DUF6300 family protein n=1 Tax=Amycolatopsis sp. NPDC049868 TaxID=3363934 RepID=UPI00378BCB27